MLDLRQLLLDWNVRGVLAQGDLAAALSIAGVTPGRAQWRRFLQWFAAGAGAILLSTGAVYFVAFNWHDLPRFAKFALVEAPIVAAIAACLVKGPDAIFGMAALGAAAILTGGLLALAGQTYQTGADTYELFAAWALAILPWALAGRQPPLWLLFLAIVNLAAQLYVGMQGGLLGRNPDVWTLFLVNASALALWETLRTAGVAGFIAPWAMRVVAVASGFAATIAGCFAIAGSHGQSGWFAAAWLAWLAAIILAFRVRRVDVFVLAGAVLSVVVVVAAFLGKHLLRENTFFAPLLVAAVVVGIATGGGVWLKRLAQQER